MNPFEMVVAIIFIIFTARVLRDRFRAQALSAPAQPDGETLHLRQEVRELKERIQVLERVITDNHQTSSLDRQIESLRDR